MLHVRHLRYRGDKNVWQVLVPTSMSMNQQLICTLLADVVISPRVQDHVQFPILYFEGLLSRSS